MDDFRVMRLSPTDVKIIDGGNSREINGQMFNGFDIEFVNLTDMTLRVKSRLGMVQTILPKENPYARGMYSLNRTSPGVGIRVRVSIPWADIEENLTELEKTRTTSVLSSELYYSLKEHYQDIKEQKIPNWFRETSRRVTATAMFVVHYHEIEKGYCYYPELDLSFGLFGYSEEPTEVPHPNTQDKLNGAYEKGVDYFHRAAEGDSNSLNLSIQFVEETPDTYGSKYIHILGETYKVPIVPGNPEKPEGVYVRRNFSPRNLDGSRNRTHIRHFDIKEAEETLGMASTVEAARNGGCFKAVYERARQDNELALLLEKKELERLKDENAKYKVYLDGKERELKAHAEHQKQIISIREDSRRHALALEKIAAEHSVAEIKRQNSFFGEAMIFMKGVAAVAGLLMTSSLVKST